MKPGPKPTPPIIRFWRHVAVPPEPGACWEWTGSVFQGGYGQFGISRCNKIHAHRWLYEYLHGLLPVRWFALHRCDNRRCVRPSHIWAGTKRDNTRDMMAKGRWYSPYAHGRR